jgi:ATP-dependent Clp protease protease subunit
MKKVIFIALMSMALAATPVMGETFMELLRAMSSTKPPQTQCPKTLMVKDCLKCHVVPTFELKEKKRHAQRSYPNDHTSIIEVKSSQVGYYMLKGDVNRQTSEEVRQYFEYLEHLNIKKAIVEVQSPGGSLFEGWRIHGIMEHYQSRGMIVETRCYGWAASAGFIIFVSGTKGHRLVSPQAELMWHELKSFKMFDVSSPADKEDEAEVLRHLQNTANTWLASVSKLSKEELDEKVHKKELWLNGKQAIEQGFADGPLNRPFIQMSAGSR